MKNLITFLIVACIVFISCSKDKDPETTKTKTELIVAAPWKFSSVTVMGADVSAALQPCQKDNIATLQANGNGTLDEGATKCNAGDPQSSAFTWSFTSNETILQVSTILFTGGSNNFTVESITSTTLVLSQVIVLGGVSQTAVFTFVH